MSTEHFLKSKVSQASSYPFLDDKYFTWKQWERNIGGDCPSVSKQIVLVSVSSVQSVSWVWLSATPWTAARQASLSITNSRSWLKPMSIESVMPSNHLILFHPLLLPPSVFPRIRVFSNEPLFRKDYFYPLCFCEKPRNKQTGWKEKHVPVSLYYLRKGQENRNEEPGMVMARNSPQRPFCRLREPCTDLPCSLKGPVPTLKPRMIG